MKFLKALSIVSLFIILSSCGCQYAQDIDRDAALKEFKKQVEEALPVVVSLTGIQKSESVEVDMFTKAELGTFFESIMEIEFPDDAMKKRSQCFAEIGLLPRGYDVTTGFLELLKEQAGAVYDQHSKRIRGVCDLSPEQKRVINDKMIISHELTHALQDRIIDIVQHSEMGLQNIDYEYSFRAVIEGMASGVMLAYAQNLAFDELPDLKTFWRSNLSRATGGALARSPQYLKEYLFSPYAEGGAFIQSWLKANPDKTLNDLFNKIPSSSEQVLHFDRYTGGDEPAKIDVAKAGMDIPGNWTLLYVNTLGEFDVLKLFEIHDETQANATELATGWDGCQFEAYTDKSGHLILFGTSVWDSEKDAEEFSQGFRAVLKSFRDSDDFKIVEDRVRVDFVLGLTDGELRDQILVNLSKLKVIAD